MSRILIAEDDRISQKLAAKIVEELGHTAFVSPHGKHAYEALKAGNDFDLLLTDIMMPEMDGQEALRKIRELEEQRGISPPNGAKIVMTTALDDPKNVIAAYQNLCDTYIIKPIQKKMLLEALRKLKLI